MRLPREEPEAHAWAEGNPVIDRTPDASAALGSEEPPPQRGSEKNSAVRNRVPSGPIR